MKTTATKAPVFTAKIEGKYGEFVLEPLEQGFGVTLGNPLRRILLSSIAGTAVTSVYIEDVLHEFSALPGIKEDVVQLILNLKELVVKLYDQSSATLTLRAEGPCEVTARDLIVPMGVEVINKDQHIATLGEKGRLVMEIRVDQGVGYVAAEKHGIKDRINSTPVDALFSPVRRVATHVEDTRLGQRTDLDKLIIRIWTDGSAGPNEVLEQAVGILKEQLGFLVGAQEEQSEPATQALTGAAAAAPQSEADQEVSFGSGLDDLGLTTRVLHSLKEEGIDSIQALMALSEKDLKRVPGIGERSLQEIKEQLVSHALELKE